MANNLGDLVTKFTNRLDLLLMEGTKTADLNMNQDLLGDYQGAGIIKIPSITMDGLGDYDRANGFPAGDVDLTWEQYQMKHDRGREFSIDVMDDEERAMIVSANVMAEFARTKVIPEVDAIRFAALATAAGKTEEMETVSKDTIEDAILTAEEVVGDTGVELTGCVLYVTSAVKRALRQAMPYHMDQGQAPDGRFETFDGIKLVTVPQDRFYTAVKLNDGKTGGQEDGGYAKDEGAKDIRFMLVHPEAAAALQRHETLRYFSPEVYQAKNAHLWQYRLYHDLLVFKNKKALIYACTSQAA